MNLARLQKEKSQQSTLLFRRVPLGDLLSLKVEECAEVRVSSKSLFGESQWDFSEESHRPAEELVLNFDFRIDAGRRLGGDPYEEALVHSVKCLTYSLLVDPPHPRIKTSTIVKDLSRGGILNLVRFMVSRRCPAFSELSYEEFEEFLLQESTRPKIAGSAITDRTLRNRVRGLDWLVLQADKLKDRLSFDPWRMHGSLNSWSISTAKQVVERGVLRTSVIPDSVVREMFATAVEVLERAGSLCEAAIAFEARSKRKTYLNTFREIDTDHGRHQPAFGTSFQFEKYGFSSWHDMVSYYGHLRVSVALLIGLLSGMRPAEILSISSKLEEACGTETIEIEGVSIKCVFVHSSLTKNVATAQKRAWQTVPLVHDAISILATTNRAIFEDECPWLFRSFKTRSRQKRDGIARILPADSLSLGLKKFVQDFQIDMQSWGGNLSGRSLRRTFARLVTRNGLGIIELQDQLKHFDPEITRMYGEASLIQAVQGERVSLSEELYEELLSGIAPISGGASDEVNSLRDTFKGLTRPQRVRFIKSLSSDALIDQVDAGLCIYRPKQSLCGGNKANCKPDVCNNSAIVLTEARVRALTNMQSENMRLLKLCKSNSLQKNHLIAQLNKIEKILFPILSGQHQREGNVNGVK